MIWTPPTQRLVRLRPPFSPFVQVLSLKVSRQKKEVLFPINFYIRLRRSFHISPYFKISTPPGGASDAGSESESVRPAAAPDPKECHPRHPGPKFRALAVQPQPAIAPLGWVVVTFPPVSHSSQVLMTPYFKSSTNSSIQVAFLKVYRKRRCDDSF